MILILQQLLHLLHDEVAEEDEDEEHLNHVQLKNILYVNYR